MQEVLEFTKVLERVQRHLSDNYSAALSDPSKHDQVRSYVAKYLRDNALSVRGMTLQQLTDRLYTEMVEYSFLTQYLTDRDDVEVINVNSWDDVAFTYIDGRIE